MRRMKVIAVAMLMAAGLAACATQQAMTVDVGAIGQPNAKYRSAMAVRNVGGGQVMNALTVPGVTNDAFKAALEQSLASNGYLAHGAAKYYVDVEIQNLDQPLIGLDMDVTSSVTYKVTGPGTSMSYPISAKGTATLSDSPLGVDRMRIANERAMQQSIRLFLQALR